MLNLYKAMPGSPITYLINDITAEQTNIAIADDSALPDAPNICTVGFGENIETIKYTDKSNGVLQNVTRGIEGTPRAWQKGTEVARYFTAYDHNNIIKYLTEDIEEIVSCFTNSNGSCIMFKDGTAISYGTHSYKISSLSQLSTSGLYTHTTENFRFATVFDYVPDYVSVRGQFGEVVSMNNRGVTSSYVNSRMLCINDSQVGNYVDVNVLAIGRVSLVG